MGVLRERFLVAAARRRRTSSDFVKRWQRMNQQAGWQRRCVMCPDYIFELEVGKTLAITGSFPGARCACRHNESGRRDPQSHAPSREPRRRLQLALRVDVGIDGNHI